MWGRVSWRFGDVKSFGGGLVEVWWYEEFRRYAVLRMKRTELDRELVQLKNIRGKDSPGKWTSDHKVRVETHGSTSTLVGKIKLRKIGGSPTMKRWTSKKQKMVQQMPKHEARPKGFRFFSDMPSGNVPVICSTRIPALICFDMLPWYVCNPGRDQLH